MSALTLKTYQTQALASMERFLVDADRTGSLAAAWAQEQQRQAVDTDDALRAAVSYQSGSSSSRSSRARSARSGQPGRGPVQAAVSS
jgi:hypothetical protein